MGACRSTFLQQSYAAYSTYQIKQLKERTEKSNNTKKKQTRLHSFKQIFKRVNKRMAGEQQYQKDFHPKNLYPVWTLFMTQALLCHIDYNIDYNIVTI